MLPLGAWRCWGTFWSSSGGLGWPLRALVVFPGKGVPGQAAARRFGGLRCARPPLRCSLSWPAVGTRFSRCARFAQTTPAIVMTKRAARAATRAALLGASHARRSLPGHDFAAEVSACEGPNARAPSRLPAAARWPVGGLSAQPRSAGMTARARSAPRPHTHRSCPSETSAAREASSAVGPAFRASQGSPKGQAVLPTHGLPRSGCGQPHERAKRLN